MFTGELTRYIVSRSDSYSERGRTTAGSCPARVIMASSRMRFDVVDNFGKLLGGTVIGESFHRVTSRYWGKNSS